MILPSTTGIIASSLRGVYLDTTVGYASTPDFGTLPIEHVFAARVLGPANPTTAGDIASQYDGTTTNSSWAFQRYASGTEPRLRLSLIVEPATSSTRFCQGPPITGADDYVAMSSRNSGANWLTTTYTSDDGKTWTQAFTDTGAVAVVHDSPLVVTVGQRVGGTSIFAGRVYWVELRTGLDPTAGGSSMAVPGYITLPATAGNFLSTPAAAALDITADICIVARIYRVAWTGATSRVIVAKWGATVGTYRMGLRNDGYLTFTWSADGSTSLTTTSTANVAATPASSWLWVAVSFDVVSGTNRETKFWTSNDNVTWTQLGTTVTGTSGATSILPSADPLRIGSLNSFDSTMFDGNVAHVSVRSGIGAGNTVGGTEVFRFEGTNLPSSISTAATTFTASTGQTVTINRSGSPQTTIVPTVDGLLWRFDAADYVSGTSITDPRGRVWTLSTAAAIGYL